MGKQRKKQTTPSESANSVDWELRVRELYRAGLVSIHALTRPLPREERR